MAKNDVQVNFRMPQELREKLQASAEANNRTITSEIVARLELSFAVQSLKPAQQAEALNTVAEVLVKLEKSIEARDHVIKALGTQLATIARITAKNQPEISDFLHDFESVGSAYGKLDFPTGVSGMKVLHDRMERLASEAAAKNEDRIDLTQWREPDPE